MSKIIINNTEITIQGQVFIQSQNTVPITLPAEIFIQDPSDYICTICNDISHPLVLTECSHPFCEPCITTWITQTKNECPVCRKPNPKPKKPDPFIERMYNSSQVKCLHFSKGCEYQGELKDMLESHLKNYCEFAMISCTNKGCNAQIEKRELQNHFQVCKFRSVKCQYCESDYIFKDEKIHALFCERFPHHCDHCGAKIGRNVVDQHLEICPEVEVQCTIVGCTKKFKRKELQNHEKEDLINHLNLMNKYLMEENEKMKNTMNELSVKCQKLEKENEDLKLTQELFSSKSNICYPFGPFAKSIDCLRNEASNGNINAQLNLGMCYFIGIKKIRIDFERAKDYIIKAAKEKHLFAIGMCYFFGWGKYKTDYDKALKYFVESYTKKRDVWAMYQIGECYFFGRGVTKDIKQAVKWFMEAASFKCPIAMTMIGTCYAQGIGVERNEEEAFKWFMKGADEDHSVSLFNVGVYYESKRDIERARTFYSKSALLGYKAADEKMNQLLTKRY